MVYPLVGTVALIACGLPLSAQTGPQPDVFLAALSVTGTVVRVGAPRNLTAREGYDNQPAFSPDGRALYFTSTRADAQADIYRYDVRTQRTSRVTVTAPESEYSATVMPGGDALSVIRVERDSTQRLWRVPLGGGPSTVILERVKPVGYHAWADDHRLALFVLGSPAVLQLADSRTGASDTVASNIGRSLHRMPHSTNISFVSKAQRDTAWVMSLDVDTRVMRRIAPLPSGVEDYAWLPGGQLIAGQGSKLFVFTPPTAAGSTPSEWVEVADLSTAGLNGISRLAISPSGDRIAIVALPTLTR